MNTLFIDFDGTLVDVSQKYYAVYKKIAQKNKIKELLSKDEYWNKIRGGLSFVKLLKEVHGINNTEDLQKEFISFIEEPKYLKLDKEFKGIKETLSSLKGKYNLVLVSLRRNKFNLVNQLKSLTLDQLFDEILSVAGEPSGVEAKCNLIKGSKFFNSETKYMIGDTGVDIKTAYEIGGVAVSVLSGLRNLEYLSKLFPKYTIKEFSELPILLEKENNS